MKKRGFMQLDHLVYLILAIFAFVILGLIFLPQLLKNDLTDRDLCKLSIVERATIPDLFKNAIPLKCRAEKICISESGKKDACVQFAGEEDIVAVKLKGSDQEKTALIEKTSAEAMFNCWDMTGRGRFDIFPSDSAVGNIGELFSVKSLNFEVKQPKCIVCGRVAIADDVTSTDEGKKVVDAVDINEYMRTKQVPNSRLTFLQTFTDRSISGYAGVDEKNEDYGIVDQTNQLAFIFMQIKSPSSPGESFEEVAFGGLMVGGGGLMTGTGSRITKVGARAIGGWPLLVIYLGSVGATAGFASYAAYESQLTSAAYCGEFESNSEESKKGCSLVRGVDWKISTVNNLCKGGIEGSV